MKEEMKDEKGETLKEEQRRGGSMMTGEEVKTADSVAIVPAVVPLDSAAVNSLWTPVIKELQTLWWQSASKSFVALHLPDGLSRGPDCLVHSLCMADYSHDGELLPEAC